MLLVLQRREPSLGFGCWGGFHACFAGLVSYRKSNGEYKDKTDLKQEIRISRVGAIGGYYLKEVEHVH